MISIDERFWTIELNGEEVEHLFDTKGSETFDPTATTSAALREGVIIQIIPGDKITFTFNG